MSQGRRLRPGAVLGATVLRWGLVVSAVLAGSAGAVRGQVNRIGESSSALPSRDVDVVVAESPVTLRTTTEATATSTASPGTPDAQQNRPGLADVVKARLGDQHSKSARTLILFADNTTTSTTSYIGSTLPADHLFGG